MRTSRGLQVTSLIVLSPVVLILLSLLTILTTTLFSQLQLWYPSIYTTTPSLSKWVSTTTTTSFGYGSNNDSLFLQTDDTNNTTSYFSNNLPTTATTNPSHYRPSSMIHVWLKRWRHSKRKSPSFWALCGLVVLIGYVYLHKSHVQKRQVSRYLFKLATFLTRGLASVVTCCGKQTMVFWKDHVSGKKELDMSTEDLLWMDNDKSPYAKQKQQNARAAAITPTTISQHQQQRHSAKKVKKHRQRSSSIKQSSVPSSNNNKQQQYELSLPSLSTTTTTTTTDNKGQDPHVESNDWISVGDNKKKKDSVLQQQHQQPPSPGLNDHEDYDDDDKTMVDELDTIAPSKSGEMMMMIETPATSDDDEMESLDSPSPCAPCANNNNNNNNNVNCHRYDEPVIRNWYSPFSTGLDLDILPREDPLVMLDPMQLRKYDDYHHINDDDDYYYRPSDNFSLLQNHPFIIKKQRLPMSPPLGAIGQPHTSSPSTSSSSHVQNSTRHPFSLFI